MSIALGIDTGGTYTDAVLVEHETSRVLASAKALTTKHDLALGIHRAVERVMAHGGGDVRLVSLSTTLATNAIVEEHGAPICVLLIGYQGRVAEATDFESELGTSRYAFIPGGHQPNGEESEPLDVAVAREAILEHAPHVAAFAVSGYFGTRNPAHELAVKRLIAELTGLHVTCGHELTHRLHAMRRATTVALNARLIPLIADLISAVERTMADKGIDAPLMVVKGDGSLIGSTVARERPIETILSGPAASVVGARHLSGDGDSVIVDMGGTTTDIAVISQGRPELSEQGARVGRWRTMVEAIGVHTVGLGGDSRVWLDDEAELRLGPRRVVPVCLLAAEHPGVRRVLSEQLARGGIEPTDGEFLLLQRQDWGHDGEHPAFEADLMSALGRGPCPIDHVERIMRHPRLYIRYLERLERQGILIRAAFTPTDAAHVVREYLDWDEEAARLAAQLLARRLGSEAEVLCRRIIALASERIAAEVIAELLTDETSDGHHDALDARLIARALRPSPKAKVACSLKVRPTLVAIGAPVRTYFPAVSRLLHSRLRIPEHTEVANAIGAIVGSVLQRIHVLIVPQEDEGIFRVHFPDGMADFQSLGEALAHGEKRGSLMAVEAARRAGAEDAQVQVDRQDHSAPVGTGWGEELYLRTVLEVTATGRPRLARC